MYIKKSTLIALAIALVFGMVLGLTISINFHSRAAAPAVATVVAPRAATQPNRAIPPLPENLNLLSTSKAFVQVARRVVPTVVSITSNKVNEKRRSKPELFHFWRQPGDDAPGNEPDEPREQGLGSGVIMSEDGLIVTNYHVVKGADEIYVSTDDERFKAEIVGTDPSTDIAVIKIDVGDQKLRPIVFGNSDELEVGEWVLAVGNPFSLMLHNTITAGIVSGKGRVNVGLGDIEYEDFIQTDAAINPGNSGGALVNLRGELVGINTAIYSGGYTGGNLGVGFAVPVNLVKYVTDELVGTGKVTRGWLGVVIQPVDAGTAARIGLQKHSGALVTGLQKGPAEQAGIRPGDVIVEFAGAPVESHNHLMQLVAVHHPGEKVEVKVFRDGTEKAIFVILGERPDRYQMAMQSRDVYSELGFRVRNMSSQLAQRYGYDPHAGVIIVRVEDGSMAANEGIQVGDIILSVNKQAIRTVSELYGVIDKARAGDGVVLLHLNRQGSKFFVALELK